MDILREATVPELRDPACVRAVGVLVHVCPLADDVRADHIRNHRLSGLELAVLPLEVGLDAASFYGDCSDSVRDSVLFY